MGGLLAVILLVAAAVLAVTLGQGSRGARANGQASANGRQRLATETTARNQAVAWVASQVGRDIVVACDAVTCADLAERGFPVSSLNVLQPTAPDPYGSELVIATASVRSQFGSKLASVYAPEVLASFGAGAARIDIRLIAANGPAAFRVALSTDLLARKHSGAEVARNARIAVAPAAMAQLKDGLVDSRLLTTIAFLAVQQPLRIVAFGGVAAGASPGVPLRCADLAATDAAAHLSGAAYVRSLIALVGAQRPPYAPLSVRTVRLPGGQIVLRIEFAAPSPLSLSP
jgi:hypothetical protein